MSETYDTRSRVSDEPAAAFGSHRFIFVGGLHRSGTTALFEMLRDHPQVSGFRFPRGAEREHEGQFHQTVYPTSRKGEGPGYFGLVDATHLNETSPLATDSNARKLFDEWGRYWDLSKEYLLEKSPQNLVRTRFLQALFPRSYFIIIVRHPVAVSLATMKWMGWPRHHLSATNPNGSDYRVRPATDDDHRAFYESPQLYTESILFTMLEHWVTGHERYLGDAALLRRKLLVRYEDLVADPEACMKSIWAFLELTSVPQVRSRTLSNHNDRYLREWRTMAPDVLSEGAREFLVSTFSDHVLRFGYSLSDIEHLGTPDASLRGSSIDNT